MSFAAEPWRQRLFEGYVSSGQAGVDTRGQLRVQGAESPYYRHIIKRFLPADRGIWIADLGCGHGSLVSCLRSLGYSHVQGVDVSPEQVALAQSLGVTDIRCQDIVGFLAERQETFDVVFLMDVLEHLTRAELFEMLDLVHARLAATGIAVIHVPNGEGIFGMGIRYGDLTHEICFTSQSIQQALASCGFAGVRCFEDRPVVHGLKSLIRRALWNILTLAPRLLLLAETGTGNHILSRNMLVIAAKAA